MKVQKKQIVMMSVLVVLLTVGLAMLNGCKKSEPQTMTGHEGHDHAMPAEPAKMIDQAKAVVAEVIEQKTCPIMGGPIDKTVFTEYKGKKVYFCCPACKPKFEANPEKYIAQLPQFK
jgi:YHS domain-containing protein